MTITAVILAAGQGKRMHSRLPKVLHSLAGQPLLGHILQAVQPLNLKKIVIVVGHGAPQIKGAFPEAGITWVMQEQQLGTGHALLQALPETESAQQVLVLLGDTPLISVDTLQKLINSTPTNAIGLITVDLAEPTGFGRIVRNKQNHVIKIVEEKDATEAEKQITEINTGIMLLPQAKLAEWLPALKNTNQQAEYYLTDIMVMAVKDNVAINTVQPAFAEEVLGVNDRRQLALLERVYQDLAAERLLVQGVTLLDPTRFDLRGQLAAEKDVTIDINVIIEGKVTIGANSYIGPNVLLKNVIIGANVNILANSVIEDSVIGNDCNIGPFARLRPGTELADHVKVGNFVETKKAIVGEGSKLPHLSYVGDAKIGKNVNIGAGVITCNYDGVHKYQTTIGDNAFIGSDSQLIAPVEIGAGAYIGAGSSINKDAPPGKLTVARARQTTIEKWTPPKK